MKKLLLATTLISSLSFAQLKDVKKEISKIAVQNNDTIDGWKNGGIFSFSFNQSAFSNWVAGGVNNIAGNASVNYDINYKNGPWNWDNKIILAYGISKNKGEEVDYRKTDDRIELNSLVGREAFGYWKYSLFANFRTQFTDGYNYNAKDLPVGTTYKDFPNSGFMKPAYLTFGPGLLWRQSDNLKFNIAPVTSKITLLLDKVYDLKTFKSSDEVEMFGIEPGKHYRYELGMYATGYYKVELMENITLENIAVFYSNYLDDFQNIDVDYTMNLAMKINKYITTNLTVQTVYDDDAFKGLQVREVFGLGFNLNF
ncbi:DUF3078 domain-containing protein [Weeksellaceae bacterium TAE3-ERU29]|nr:DUF3078 domain-containing protein [Weeksellaceae bacterium TAE3-ERU29]